MSLHADVRLKRGSLQLQAGLSVADGEIVAVTGSNGAGKSSLLAAIAGLLPLEAGEVVVDGTVLERPADGIRVAPERRAVGVVFQDLLLFPHLSVLDNVAFGLRSAGVGRKTSRLRAATWVERMGMGRHADAAPAALSGGERRRVALARTLAAEPRVLLLDEPLASLDATSRDSVIATLRDHLRAFDGPCLVVSHEPDDVRRLASREVVLDGGRLTERAARPAAG